MTDVELRIRIAQSLAEVPAEVWNGCADRAVGTTIKPEHEVKLTSRITLPRCSPREDNSLTHLFHMNFCLRSRESGSVGGRTGWQPRHLLAEGPDGTLLGAAPCYVKTHSRGEYVFDHGWAEAFERAGGDYYPKLQIAVPFTPVTGPRLLFGPGPAGRRCPRRARRRPH